MVYEIGKFVNQSSSFPELFLDLTTTGPEPELFSFCHFGGARARAGKARQARLELEPRSGSLDTSEMFGSGFLVSIIVLPVGENITYYPHIALYPTTPTMCGGTPVQCTRTAPLWG